MPQCVLQNCCVHFRAMNRLIQVPLALEMNFIYIVQDSSLPPIDIYSFSRAALTNSLKFCYQVSDAIVLILGKVLTGVPKPVTASQPA